MDTFARTGSGEEQALLLAILGQQGDSLADGVARLANASRLPGAVQIDRPGFGRIGAEDRPHRLGAAGAHQPRDAQNLAPIRLERDVLDPRRRDGVRRRARPRRPRSPPGARHSCPRSRPTIIRITASGIDLLRRLRPDDLAVAQDRDAVGDAQHFLDPVRDVDDADALGLEPANLREEQLHLAVRSARRWAHRGPGPGTAGTAPPRSRPSAGGRRPSARTGVAGSTSARPTFAMASRAAWCSLP